MLDLLQPMLAFVLTLLGMATIVTVIMELIARISRRRGRVMRHMIELVFETEIKPRVIGAANKTEDQIEDQIKNTIEVILSSPLKPETGKNLFFRVITWCMNRLAANKSAEISAQDFLLRLSRTKIGTQLYNDASNEWEEVIKRIETRYDELSRAAGEWFKNSSAVGSLIIGIALAFVFNFDGLRVYGFFHENPEIAEAYNQKAKDYLKSYEEAQTRLDAAIGALDQEPDDEATNASEQAQETLDEISQTVGDIKLKQQELIAAGLPIGRAFFPYCRGTEDDKPTDSDCMLEGSEYAERWVLWAFVTLVTGVLFGLGGPFWYNAAVGLLKVTQLMRGVAPATQRPSDADAQTSKESLNADDFETIFKQREKENDA